MGLLINPSSIANCRENTHKEKHTETHHTHCGKQNTREIEKQ